MKTRSGNKYIPENKSWNELTMLYYAGLYSKLFDHVCRQVVAEYSIEDCTEEEKMEKLSKLENFVKQMKL